MILLEAGRAFEADGEQSGVGRLYLYSAEASQGEIDAPSWDMEAGCSAFGRWIANLVLTLTSADSDVHGGGNR